MATLHGAFNLSRTVTILRASPRVLPLLAAAAAIFLVALQQHRRRTTPRAPLLVISFGNYCFTARSLGVAVARTFAGPFDWIFTNPTMVAHVIASGGTTLLDKSEYVKPPVVGSTGHCHRTYSAMLQSEKGKKRSNKHGIVFSHHDPTCDEDHAYLHRTVCRLRAALASSLPKLCVLVSLEKRAELDDGALEHLHATLARHSNPDADATLVVVKLTTQPPGASQAGVGLSSATTTVRRRRHSTMRIVEMRCRSGLCGQGLALVEPDDRHDLLVAIFGNDATFEPPDVLTAPEIAPDPLTSLELAPDPLSGAVAHAAGASTRPQSVPPPAQARPEADAAAAREQRKELQTWCRSHNGVHCKYRSDRYMASREWAHAESRRLVGDTLQP